VNTKRAPKREKKRERERERKRLVRGPKYNTKNIISY